MNAAAAGILLNISRQTDEPAPDLTPPAPAVEVPLESALEPPQEPA
jgi:hypothetical protein